jgi:hypothetical protein
MTDISPHKFGDDGPTMLEAIRAGVQAYNRAHGIETKSARKSAAASVDDETSTRLATLAVKLMKVHSAFAGRVGVRDENDNSVALGLALRCVEMMREQRE